MKKRTFAILGLGIFGSSIAQELYQRNFEVIAIDTDIVKVDKIASIDIKSNEKSKRFLSKKRNHSQKLQTWVALPIPV